MNEIVVPHALGSAAAIARLGAALRKRSIVVESGDGGANGTLSKQLPFVGSIRAEFSVRDDAVVVRVVEAPAFPTADTIRRMVEDELRHVLA